MSPFNALFAAVARPFRTRSELGSSSRRASSRRRRQRAAAARLGGCEQLEPKQVMAANLLAAIADQTITTSAPVTINLASHFDETVITGTVVKFATNAPVANPDFYVEMFDQLGAGRTRTTPATVSNFLSYVNDPDALDNYDETIIHRSVPGFVIQGGGYSAPSVAADLQGSDPVAVPQKSAVVNEPGNANTAGTIAMAKLGGLPDSATNQFFFNLGTNSDLDTQNGGFTVFGRVLGSGMTVINTMASALTYNATTYYGDQAFSDFPLWNVNADNIVQPNDFVKFTDVSVAPELSYTVTVTENGQVSNKVVVDQALLANGQLKLTPAANATGAVSVTVTGRSVADGSTANRTFGVNLGQPAPTLTLFEGLGNTSLYSDQDGILYASASGPEAAVRLSLGGAGFTKDIYLDLGWTVAGAENRSGVNTVLLRNINDGRFWIWTMDSSWNWQSGVVTQQGKGDFFDAELDFSIDGNLDGILGLAVRQLRQVVTTRNMAGKLYANGQAITVGSAHLSMTTYAQAGWVFQGAESVNGVNTVIFTNADGKMWKWTLDESWVWQKGELRVSGEGRYFDGEIDFQIDADNDGVVGFAKEREGSTFLVAYSDDRLFVNGHPIMVGSNQASVNYLDWLVVRAEVNNGVNQLLLSHADGRLWTWTLDQNWKWLSGKVLSSGGGYFNAEIGFGYDGNGDGIIGAPYEQNGQVFLATDKAGRLFVDGRPIRVGSEILTVDKYTSLGWIVRGAETVSGRNTLVFSNSSGRLWQWTFNATWEYERGRVYESGSYKFWNAEIAFMIDADGDGFRGAPLDGHGATTLSMDDANALLLNNTFFVTVGRKTLTRQFYAKQNWYVERAEVINGTNMMLFKNSLDNRLWIWRLSETWSWESNLGVFDVGSRDYHTYENVFGIDADGGGIGS